MGEQVAAGIKNKFIDRVIFVDEKSMNTMIHRRKERVYP